MRPPKICDGGVFYVRGDPFRKKGHHLALLGGPYSLVHSIFAFVWFAFMVGAWLVGRFVRHQAACCR